MDAQSGVALETELDVDEELIEDLPDDISSDSDEGGDQRAGLKLKIPSKMAGISSFSQTTPPISPMTNSPKDIMEASYLVRRMNQSNGTIFYQTRGGRGSTARSSKRSSLGRHFTNYWI